MARRAEEAENHWPGFVDVLSTIVMVVTFLLIILGIVIFVISKNISTELAKAAQEVSEAQAALVEAQDKADEAKEQADDAKAQAQAQAQAQAESQASDQNQQSSAKSEKSAASFRTQLSDELTQNDEIESEDKLSIRTRQTRTTKQIVVSTTEQEKVKQKIKVTSSTAVLSLLFKGGVKITQAVSAEVQTYLKSNISPDSKEKYEIRAFFNTAKGSISEARRLAYYRALATRNQLLSLGVKATDISIKVGSSERSGDEGKVNIYLK